MRFGVKVERWRSLVRQEAAGIPEDLVLGIIWRESAGTSGAIGRRKTKCALIPSAGGIERVCRALGLMQIAPGNIARWNTDRPGQVVTYEDLTGKTTMAARKQIQLGIFILRRSLAWLRRYGFPWPSGNLNDEQIRIGLMVYAWGSGNMQPYLDKIRDTRRPITAAGIGARWPGLGKPKNEPLRYSRLVWHKAFGTGIAPVPEKRPTDGLGWGILAIAVMAALATTR